MNRLTKDDVKEMGMFELSHNQVFIKDGEAWYRDFEREISARDLAKEMFDFHNVKYSSNLDEFDEDMMYLLDDGYETIEGIIALFYRALWSMADVREKLKEYEDTGLEPEEVKQLNASDASKEESSIKYYNEMRKYRDELKYYKKLEEQDLLIKLPCKLGTKVYVVDNDFDGCTLKIYETSYNLGLYEYGAKIFLTREEAEKALEVENE